VDNRRDIDRGIAEALRYYGGPLGEKVISLAQVANMFNPVTGVESSMRAAGRAGDTSLTASERLMSAAESAADLGLALTPAFVARLARGVGATDDAAETVMDLLAGAPRVVDDGRPSRHRLFSGGAGPLRNPGTPDVLTSQPGFVYRTTGQRQIDDLIESGLVRAKPPGEKMRGGKTGEVHWAEAHPNTWYRSNAGHRVIVAPRDVVLDREGGLPLDQLEAIYEWRDGLPVDILGEILERNLMGQ